jgi:hypothetical protein
MDLQFIQMPDSPLPGVKTAIQVSMLSNIPTQAYMPYLKWMTEVFIYGVVKLVMRNRFDWGELNSNSPWLVLFYGQGAVVYHI